MPTIDEVLARVKATIRSVRVEKPSLVQSEEFKAMLAWYNFCAICRALDVPVRNGFIVSLLHATKPVVAKL